MTEVMEAADEGSEETGTPEDIFPHEASDEELAAFLSQPDDEPKKVEEDSTAPEETEDEQEAGEESEETEEQKEDDDPRLAALQQELAKLRQQVEAKESFIQRQASELGGLRKSKEQLLAQRQQLMQGLAEKDLQDPSAGIEDRFRLREIDEQVAQIDDHEAIQEHVETTRAVFNQHFQQGDVSLEDMVNSLRRDNVAEDQIQAFAQNPYAAFSPAGLVQLGHRARAESALSRVITVAKELKARAEKAEGELKNRKSGKDVLRSIENAARTTPSITAATGGSNPKKGSMANAPHQMTDADIEEFLRANE